MATIKRITLHPLDSQGKMDTSINLYPKTLRNAIINDDGTEFDVAANPEEEATEELVKIKINDTIYDISGGSILELDNETGTLTDKQIELLEKPDTVIFSTLDNNYYFLSYSDENNLYFYTLNDIISISEHSEEISLKTNYFEIDIINKTYRKITNSNLIYTKDAINNFLSTKEDISNKVTSLDADSTNTQYPSAKAVYDNFVNLREVAEGKCKTFVLRYSQTIEDIKMEIDHGEYDKITDLEGNDIKNAILNGDYDSIVLCNNLFNSQNDTLDFFSHTDEYLLIDSVNQNITSGEQGNISYLDTVGNIAKILNLGDIFLIKETQVPDRWVSLAIHNRFSNSFTLSIMETAKVDISNMVTTNTDQTITGVKTFKDEIDLQHPTGNVAWKVKAAGDYSFFIQRNDSIWFNLITTQGLGLDYTFYPINLGKDLGKSASPWNDLYLGGKVDFGTKVSGRTNTSYITTDQYDGIGIYVNGIRPINIYDNGIYLAKPILPNTTTIDIGDSTHLWKDLYLSGNISDGTNSVSVADITSSTFNVINASDIVNNTLTQEQYNLITNGKPTLIKGVYNNYEDTIILPTEARSGTYTLGMFLGRADSDGQIVGGYYLHNVNRSLYYYAQSDKVNRLGGIKSLNGKDLPAYPSNTGTFNLKQIDGTLTWTKEWYGTQAEYDALGTYDNNTIYNIIEE